MSEDGALILVSDDDDDLRELVAYRLETNGYRVVQATNGEEALAAALEHDPDAIVLDVMMPRLNGFEVCRRLREDARTARTPVILLTSRAQDADVSAGFDAGADDYIVKPFSPSELQARVRAVLARR